VLPPPEGYLKRIREICTKHNILLIFDEVITGFGRMGSAFATNHFDVTPDMITCAKGLTNAAVPAGAVISQKRIFETIQNYAHKAPGAQVEFYHGYTYRYVYIRLCSGLTVFSLIYSRFVVILLTVYSHFTVFQKWSPSGDGGGPRHS